MIFSHTTDFPSRRIYKAESMLEASEFIVLFGGNLFKWKNAYYVIL